MTELQTRAAAPIKIVLIVVTILVLAACAPQLAPMGEAKGEPVLTADAVVTPDGARLPLRQWPALGTEKAVVVAIHGFNDYGNFMAEPAKYFQAQGMTVYAYDQRGFGAAPHPGLWPGTEAMVSLRSLLTLSLAAFMPLTTSVAESFWPESPAAWFVTTTTAE